MICDAGNFAVLRDRVQSPARMRTSLYEIDVNWMWLRQGYKATLSFVKHQLYALKKYLHACTKRRSVMALPLLPWANVCADPVAQPGLRLYVCVRKNACSSCSYCAQLQESIAWRASVGLTACCKSRRPLSNSKDSMPCALTLYGRLCARMRGLLPIISSDAFLATSTERMLLWTH